jgi:biotin transport system substrate-specific component
MTTSYAKPDTLIAAALAPMDWTRAVSLVVAFSLLTALAAQIVIPIGPVPITAQTFAVLLTGALLGSRLGAMSMVVYLVEGASGLPFFYGGTSGIAHLLGPTGGYLRAFPAAAFITGAFAEHGCDSSCLHGDWLGRDHVFGLGMVCTNYQHLTSSCFSTNGAEVYSWRHH